LLRHGARAASASNRSADDNDDEDGEDESSRRYHRTSALINAASILGTYEIGNPAGRNYSNNNLAPRRSAGNRDREKRERERETERADRKMTRAARKCNADGALRAQWPYHRPYRAVVDLGRMSRRPVIAIVNRRFVA